MKEKGKGWLSMFQKGDKKGAYVLHSSRPIFSMFPSVKLDSARLSFTLFYCAILPYFISSPYFILFHNIYQIYFMIQDEESDEDDDDDDDDDANKKGKKENKLKKLTGNWDQRGSMWEKKKGN